MKESVEEPAAKINVLLQTYISQLKLDGVCRSCSSVTSLFPYNFVRFCPCRGYGLCAAIGRTVGCYSSILRVRLNCRVSYYDVYRIIHAIYDFCLKCGWAVPAKAALDLCKMVEKRM